MFTLATLIALAMPALADEMPSAGPDDTKQLLEAVDRELERDIMDVVVSDEGVYLAFAERVSFETNSAILPRSEMPAIRRMARTLQRHSDLAVQIEGHADERPITDGPYDDNDELALARAIAVQAALVQRGIDRGRLDVIGAAATERRAANAPIAQQLNRRAEVRIVPALDPGVMQLSSTASDNGDEAFAGAGMPTLGDDGVASLY